MSLYLSLALCDLLRQAQTVVERHVAGCRSCGIHGRCAERDRAEQVLRRYGRLPRRVPGLTLPVP